MPQNVSTPSGRTCRSTFFLRQGKHSPSMRTRSSPPPSVLPCPSFCLLPVYKNRRVCQTLMQRATPLKPNPMPSLFCDALVWHLLPKPRRFRGLVHDHLAGCQLRPRNLERPRRLVPEVLRLLRRQGRLASFLDDETPRKTVHCLLCELGDLVYVCVVEAAKFSMMVLRTGVIVHINWLQGQTSWGVG